MYKTKISVYFFVGIKKNRNFAARKKDKINSNNIYDCSSIKRRREH